VPIAVVISCCAVPFDIMFFFLSYSYTGTKRRYLRLSSSMHV
jgi:hypothetical protein